MAEQVMIEVEITFLPKSDGGREISDGMISGSIYRPHLVIGDPMQRKATTANENYLGVAFVCGPKHVELGQPLIAKLSLIYWPQVNYDGAKPGATFTVREGGRVVAFGKVNKRWFEE